MPVVTHAISRVYNCDAK